MKPQKMNILPILLAGDLEFNHMKDVLQMDNSGFHKKFHVNFFVSCWFYVDVENILLGQRTVQAVTD